MDVVRGQRPHILPCDDNGILVRSPRQPGRAEIPHHVRNSRLIRVKCEDAWHGAGKEVGRFAGQTLERGKMRQRKIGRSANGCAYREPGRLNRNRASPRHGIDERLRARVPAR